MGKKKILGVFLVLAILAGLWLVNLFWFKPLSIDHFFLRVAMEDLRNDPELLSRVRLLEQYGITWHNSKLTDISPTVAIQGVDRAKVNYATLNEYAPDSLEPDQRVSRDMLEYMLAHEIEGEHFIYHDYPLNQLFGVQSNLPTFLMTIHAIDDVSSADDYLARMEKIAEKFSQLIAGLEVRRKNKVIPPRFVLEKVIAEMEAFISTPAEQHVLVSTLTSKLSARNISAEKYMHKAQSILHESVYPAYRQLIDYTKNELLPLATDDAGVWKLPEGDAYYAYMLKKHTSTNLTAEQIHQVGLAEVDRIQSEMDTILKAEGYTEGTVGSRLARLSGEARFKYPDGDEGKAAYINDYKLIIADIEKGISKYFGILPKSKVDVMQIPEFKEKTAPGAYYNRPAMDGSRPGIFYINLRDMSAVTKFRMRTLAYHEAIPGHHFQIAIQQEMDDIPLFRKIAFQTAYAEGWALYAETLAAEMGYQDNPYDNLGRLRAELFRAVRLVVDTGLHYKRWTREQAITYMTEITGNAQSSVVAEIERYIVMPGQACAYKIGQLKMLELRSRAQQNLGEKFSLKEFHDVVLGNGAIPLVILENLVDEYVARKSGV